MAISLEDLARALPRYSDVRDARQASESARDTTELLKMIVQYLRENEQRLLPTGGTAAQTLTKASADDFDVEWA